MYFNAAAKGISTSSKLKTFFLCDNEEIWSDLPFSLFSPPNSIRILDQNTWMESQLLTET